MFHYQTWLHYFIPLSLKLFQLHSLSQSDWHKHIQTVSLLEQNQTKGISLQQDWEPICEVIYVPQWSVSRAFGEH